MRWFARIFKVAGLVSALSMGGAGRSEALNLPSLWRDKPLSVDGRQQDWGGALYHLDDQDINVGVMNDADTLWVGIVIGDEARQRQLLSGTWTVWIDASGGDHKRVGIRHPLRARRAMGEGEAFAMPEGEAHALPEPPEGEAPPPRERISAESLIATITPEYELLGPKGEVIARRGAGEGGIALAVGFENGAMVYELRISLVGSDAESLGFTAARGAAVGIGLEAGGQRTGGRGPGRGPGGGMGGPGGGMGRPGGDMGGRGGGMGGPGGGMGPPGGGPTGERPRAADPLKVWAKVRLAEHAGS